VTGPVIQMDYVLWQ